MNMRGALREAQRLRLKLQLDSRLHLEVLAALSRTFRENGESVSNELLRSLVFAVPDELPGRGMASAMVKSTSRPAYSKVPPQPGVGRKKPGVPPQPGVGRKKPGVPPQPGGVYKKPRRHVPPQPVGGSKKKKKKPPVPPQPGGGRKKKKK